MLRVVNNNLFGDIIFYWAWYRFYSQAQNFVIGQPKYDDLF